MTEICISSKITQGKECPLKYGNHPCTCYTEAEGSDINLSKEPAMSEKARQQNCQQPLPETHGISRCCISRCCLRQGKNNQDR